MASAVSTVTTRRVAAAVMIFEKRRGERELRKKYMPFVMAVMPAHPAINVMTPKNGPGSLITTRAGR